MTMTRDGKLCKQRQWAYLRYFWNSGEKERDLTVARGKKRQRQTERKGERERDAERVAALLSLHRGNRRHPVSRRCSSLPVMLISRVERYSLLEASLFVQPRSFFSLASLFRFLDLIFFFSLHGPHVDVVSCLMAGF